MRSLFFESRIHVCIVSGAEWRYSRLGPVVCAVVYPTRDEIVPLQLEGDKMRGWAEREAGTRFAEKPLLVVRGKGAYVAERKRQHPVRGRRLGESAPRGSVRLRGAPRPATFCEWLTGRLAYEAVSANSPMRGQFERLVGRLRLHVEIGRSADAGVVILGRRRGGHRSGRGYRRNCRHLRFVVVGFGRLSVARPVVIVVLLRVRLHLSNKRKK